MSNPRIFKDDFRGRLRSIDLGLFITSVIVLFNSWFLFYNFKNVREQNRNVERSNNIIHEIDLTLSAVKDAETGFRGYLLTHEDSYLEPYRIGTDAVWDHYKNLGILFEGKTDRLNQWKTMGDLITERLKIFSDRLDFERKGLSAKASISGATAEGKPVMDSLRRHVELMEDFERKNLEEVRDRAAQSEVYFNSALIFTTLLGLLIIFIAFIQVRKNQLRTLMDATERSRDAWLKEKIAEVSAAVAGDLTVQRLGHAVLEKISHSVNALAGNFYFLQNYKLKLAGQYGASMPMMTSPDTISLDDGLLAEAFKSNSISVIDRVPKDYFDIGSSLGKAAANNLAFVPVSFQGIRLGIIELASFGSLSEEEKNFLEQARDVIGIGLNSAMSKEQLQNLLEKTQQQSEELQTQQEELRTNNEELEQQTRALETQQQILSARNNELAIAQRDLQAKATDLESTNQYKSEFLAKMSHELRTPLNSLLILATLLIENKEHNLTEQQREFARSIHGAGNDLLNLINDILDLSKIEARKLALRRDSFRLSSIVEQMRLTFQPQVNAKGLELEFQISDSDKEFEAHTDRQRLEQILRNFLSNAIKFTEKGKINLTAKFNHDKNSLEFAVTDTGIGIPREKIDLVFEAFEQADSSVSRKYGGTGLGLTISRELAHLLGGHITVNSTEGRGSSFILEIPAYLSGAEEGRSSTLDQKVIQPRTTEKLQTPSVSNQRTREILGRIGDNERTILIVEDDERFSHSVAEICSSYKFSPIVANNGEDALDILQQHTPTAILLDIKLPGISGMGLLEMVKQMPRLRHVPIHMISALEYQQNALRLGAMGFLGKPVTLDKVKSAIARIEDLLSQKMKRVLVIEDDSRQREAIKHLVTGADIQTFTATTGKDALDQITHQHFDCIILDLSLPDMTGFELLESLNTAQTAIPPIVIYTAKDVSRKEEEQLRKYSESIIIKGARSPERLLDEVNLFLHRVEATLPQEQRQILNNLRSQEKSFEGRNLLIVDDDLRNVFALTNAMESKGFQVKIARDGIEAIELLEKDKSIDVILMDIMMPRMDGYEATKRIREMDNYKEIPIIALTAKAMKEDHEKCIEAGANDYLPKPVNLMNLVSVLKVWLPPKGIFD